MTQRKIVQLLISAVTTLVFWGLLPHSDAHARRTCIKWEIQTEDSGSPIPYGPNAGGVEDRYPGADNGAIASALGVRIKISRPGWSKVYNTEPNTGCVTWNDDNGYSGTYSVRIYGFQTDANGNYVRTHTYQGNSCGAYPGNTRSRVAANYEPTTDTDIIAVGGEGPRWTTQAMLGYSLYRYHAGVYGKKIHAGFDTSSECGSSAHYGQSNDHITEGRHCIRVSSCPDDPDDADDDRRWKFIVAHEFAHALAALHYGDKDGAVDGSEPASVGQSGWSGSVDASSCLNSSGYDITDVEWKSIGFREGFAHFIAGKVFNDKQYVSSTGQYEGAFNWQGGNANSTAEDLERGNKGLLGTVDSRYRETCCTSPGSCGSGTSIIGDWHRFFWDWYTNQGFTGNCLQQPTKLNMLWLYTRTRLEPNLTRTNYYSKMVDGAEGMSVDSCLTDAMLPLLAVSHSLHE